MNLRKESFSLRIAIVVTVLTAVLFSFLFLYLGINHRKDVYDDSKMLATEISRKAAYEIQVYILSAILNARSLEEKAQLLHDLNGSREEISEMLKAALEENQNYLGIWTLWEPNTFDNKDYQYSNNSFYNDKGILGLGYFRANDSILYEIMTEQDYTYDYYSIPKKLRTEFLTNPYYFVYRGYKHLFFGSTVSIPILIDNKFAGAIGIDIDLGKLQNDLNKIKPYESGYLSLISNNGTIVTHADTSFIAKNIFNIFDKDDTLSINAISDKKEMAFEVMSEFTGQKVLRMFYPITISEGNKPWSMMIEIPISKATFRSKQLLNVAFVTLFIGLSLLVYLIINISERKKYEKTLFKAKLDAEESDRLKSAFLNNISHEIRTPLNGILGFAELIVDESTSKEEARAYKQILMSSSKQLLSIISNVIELSKIQTGKGKIYIRSFEIDKAIQNVADSYIPTAEEKDLSLKINFPTNKETPILYSDEDKFKQILSYLLNNAVKFTHNGFIEIGYTVEQDSYLFYVKDTGIGIKPEYVKNIFRYFNQGDVSLVRKYGGLGVGLSISKSFIDMLHGSIYLESEEGKGSTFYFSLPNLETNK